MKTIIIAAVLFSTPVLAQSAYSNCYGNSCFGSDDRGNSWNSQSYGNDRNNQTFYNDSRGNNCSQQCSNGQCFTSCN